MKTPELGREGRYVVRTGPEHTAQSFGNPGVVAISSVTLIAAIESACGDAIWELHDEGEATVGVGFDLTHLAPAPAGAEIEARARLVAVDGRKLDFEAEARHGETVLMKGRHRRAVIDLSRFLERDTMRSPPS
ncbi:MAG: thioesterase [Rhodospirillaceae bacterium]|jgi:predicted thioesterase|nr:thioesterase [Rhodospirillaceae bacterium]MBT6119564.1 thioesterase [Rhodospirillaceae bacterium]